MSKAAKTREINDTIRYTMWSVFALAEPLQDADRAAEGAEVEKLFAELAEADVVVRGVYDVSGLRADADLMVWWHATTSEELQAAYNVRPAPRPCLVADGAAPSRRVQQEPRARLPQRRGPQEARQRLPVRAVLRVVPPRGRRAPSDARR